MGLRYRHIYMNSNMIWSEDKGQTIMIENPTWKQYTDEGWECPEGWRVFQISQDGKTIILESLASSSYRDPGRSSETVSIPASVLCDRIAELEAQVRKYQEGETKCLKHMLMHCKKVGMHVKTIVVLMMLSRAYESRRWKARSKG